MTFELSPNPNAQLTPQMIAYEDDFMLIIDKPAGMLVHPTVNERGFTLYDYVSNYYKAKAISADIHPSSYPILPLQTSAPWHSHNRAGQPHTSYH